MAEKQEDKKTFELFKCCRAAPGSDYISPSKSKEVQAFYDNVPDAVKTLDNWKREAVRITVETSQIGDDLIMAFDGLKQDPPQYTEEEVYEYFISTERIDGIKNLQSESALFKVLDAVKLAQDAAQDFALLERSANDATSCAGVGGVLTGLALANPVGAAVVGVSASTRSKIGKLDMRDKALLVNDICESIRSDVLLLDEIGVYASNIVKYQERVKKHGRIKNLQRDKILNSAKKMKEACHQYRIK